MSLGAAPNSTVVPLGCERRDRPAEVVIYIPDCTVRPKKPGCADGAHQGYATMAGCLTVDMAPLLARRGNCCTNPFRDMPRKVHVSRSNDHAFSGRAQPGPLQRGLDGCQGRPSLAKVSIASPAVTVISPQVRAASRH
jgi:hypothetical protein